MYYKFVKVMLLKIKSHEMEVLSVSFFCILVHVSFSDSGSVSSFTSLSPMVGSVISNFININVCCYHVQYHRKKLTQYRG